MQARVVEKLSNTAVQQEARQNDEVPTGTVHATHIISQPHFITGRNRHKLLFCIKGTSKKMLNQARLLLKPKSDHACQQKFNLSGGQVPLKDFTRVMCGLGTVPGCEPVWQGVAGAAVPILPTTAHSKQVCRIRICFRSWNRIQVE